MSEKRAELGLQNLVEAPSPGAAPRRSRGSRSVVSHGDGTGLVVEDKSDLN